jgi:hypothetical protein
MRFRLATTLVLIGTPLAASAQFFGGVGVGAGSVPRSLEPLCESARRLSGPTAGVQAGMISRYARISTGVNVTFTMVYSVADCVPMPPGTSTHSTFAPAGTSATTINGDVWFLPSASLNPGIGAGWVPGHDSWFMSAGIGAQFRKLRLELSARRHRTSFDDVTYDVGNQGAREISRVPRSESSWGGLATLSWVTR